MLRSSYKENTLEAGCDEAGRGCMAGPVFAAAVILKTGFYHPEIKDSKKLTEKKRYELRKVIEKEAVCYSIASIDNNEIDKINIFKASMKAMHIAIGNLIHKPELLLIDGNLFLKYDSIPHVCIVKGDDKFLSIAAASILAKTYRDDFMRSLHKQYPYYDWINNKGYGTLKHRLAIKEHGLTKYHRKTFNLKDNQLCINF